MGERFQGLIIKPWNLPRSHLLTIDKRDDRCFVIQYIS